jgi:hypothetical protein
LETASGCFQNLETRSLPVAALSPELQHMEVENGIADTHTELDHFHFILAPARGLLKGPKVLYGER